MKHSLRGFFDHLLLEKVAKGSAPGVGGHAICPRRRMFYEGQPIWQNSPSRRFWDDILAILESLLEALEALWTHFANFGAPLGNLFLQGKKEGPRGGPKEPAAAMEECRVPLMLYLPLPLLI